jgi:FtsH-binding integral membrane protein
MPIIILIFNIDWLFMVWGALGYVIITLYTGFDLWRIKNTERFLDSIGQTHDKDITRRFGIFFGFSLLTDYVNLVMFLSRIFSYIR